MKIFSWDTYGRCDKSTGINDEIDIDKITFFDIIENAEYKKPLLIS